MKVGFLKNREWTSDNMQTKNDAEQKWTQLTAWKQPKQQKSIKMWMITI
jgi:hypothetical protein